MKDKGYIHLYTGTGKGKTTASLGLALRAHGAGLSVLFIQFLKKGDFSEIKALNSLGGITVEQYGSAEFYRPQNGDYIEHRGYSKKGYTRALNAVKAASFDLVICDEIISAFGSDLVTYEELLALTAAKAPSVELVLTGRGAPSGLYDSCDLVTEMTGIKHYYEAGVTARTGIEL
jgi:cob(I)alamin adenosyltransferase